MKPTDHPVIRKAIEAKENPPQTASEDTTPSAAVTTAKDALIRDKENSESSQGLAVNATPFESWNHKKIKMIHTGKGWRLIVGTQSLDLLDGDLAQFNLYPDGRGQVQLTLVAEEFTVTKRDGHKPRRPRGSRGRGGRK